MPDAVPDSKPVLIIATCDTKGEEALFLRDRLRSQDVSAQLVDVSCSLDGGQQAYMNRIDIPREELLQGQPICLDRGDAVLQMTLALSNWIAKRITANSVGGVIGLGGSAGTTIATAAMRRLPIAIPKIMVSTLASGNVRAWVADQNIAMFNSIVDIAGLNRISRTILDDAARAMAGMMRFQPIAPVESQQAVVAATMFGVTTPCVQQARRCLESATMEVIVFHATGSGGQAMESLIESDAFDAVLDMTTTELADELVGGILSAGPNRLTAAGRKGLPQLIGVGALDMVNFGPMETVPSRFRHRQFHIHNPTVTLMRTDESENFELGRQIASRAKQSIGPTEIWFPTRGVSALDIDGGPFDSPTCRLALQRGIESELARSGPGDKQQIRLVIRDEHINDLSFSQAAAMALIDMLKN
jgi:uncharacterized protein (UPF0261 family)